MSIIFKSQFNNQIHFDKIEIFINILGIHKIKSNILYTLFIKLNENCFISLYVLIYTQESTNRELIDKNKNYWFKFKN